MKQGKLAISTAKNDSEIDSIILKEKAGLTISDRIFEQNGHLVMNYGDQFVPNIVPYTVKDVKNEKDVNKLFIQMDLLNAF